jgi:hypothetical protein
VESFSECQFLPILKEGISFLLIFKFRDVGNFRRMERPVKE